MENLLQPISIPYVKENTNFWLIRTKKGYFYDEFLQYGFVALGWNLIDKTTNVNKSNLDDVKDKLAKEYSTSQPGVIVGKCTRFIYEMQEGDIIMMPSAKSMNISFAKVGEYYEDKNTSLEEEKEITKRIEQGEDVLGTLKCPYKKRRKITLLKTVKNEDLNINLYRALNSYHGLSNINEYKIDLLNAIFSMYYYDNLFSITFNVEREGKISPKEIGRFLLNVHEYLEREYGQDISTKLNLNSPGDIILAIQMGYDFLVDNYVPLLGLIVVLTGGKAFGFEFNSVADIIIKFKTMGQEVENKKLDTEGKKLANHKTELEIKLLEKEIEEKESANNLEQLSKTANYLKTDFDSNVVNISEYFQKNDDK